MLQSMQAIRFPEALGHSEKALQLHRKVEASRGTLRGAVAIALADKLADKAAPDGLFDTIVCLGQLYDLLHRSDDALRVYEDVLSEMREHCCTHRLQEMRSKILSSTRQIYICQYQRQNVNGDKNKCSAAKNLFEEALGIMRSSPDASFDWMLSLTLGLLASAHMNLGMFDDARCTLKEALDLSRVCHGEENAEVAACYQRVASICREQAAAIKAQVSTHITYLATNLTRMSCYHLPGTRVLVKGLQMKPQFNGLEGVVVGMDGLRIGVRLETLDNNNLKEVMLKPEDVCLLVSTAAKVQELFCRMQDLIQECIANSIEFHRIQLKVTGTKHIIAAIACHFMGFAYLATGKPAETRLAVQLLSQAHKILRRVGHAQDDALLFSKALSEAKALEAQFDEVGVLSAMPCCWKATSRDDDETHMSMLFAALQERNGNTLHYAATYCNTSQLTATHPAGG